MLWIRAKKPCLNTQSDFILTKLFTYFKFIALYQT